MVPNPDNKEKMLVKRSLQIDLKLSDYLNCKVKYWKLQIKELIMQLFQSNKSPESSVFA